MTTPTTTSLPLLLLLLLLAASATARPCKTIFFFTSTSYYTLPQNQNHNPNPNPHFLTLYLTSTPKSINSDPNPNRFFLIPKPFSTRLVFDRIGEEEQKPIKKIQFFSDFADFSGLPSRVYGSVESSIRDRSKDIMSVVGALLFGMGCGALTAATMYLIWSLFMPNRFQFEDSDDEEFDDLYDPKKMVKGGYVAIPSKGVDDQEVKKNVGEQGA